MSLILPYDKIYDIILDLIGKASGNSVESSSSNSKNSPSGGSTYIQVDPSQVIDQHIDIQVKSETGYDLEKYMKLVATNWFSVNTETHGSCGGVTYRLANALAEKLRNKEIPNAYGNDAYSSTLRKNLKDLGIYSQESFTPVGQGLTDEQFRKKISEISQQADYGDVLVYFAQEPPVSVDDKAKYHAQIYTGNLYKGIKDSFGDIGVGWTTDNKSNYGSEAVYRSAGGHPWTIYWFRIKEEYKGAATSATVQQSGSNKKDKASLKKSASAFNSLTYRLSIIYKLLDNYGSKGAPLFEPYSSYGGDNENNAVAALKKWMNKENQQAKYREMTYDDQDQYNKYLAKLYTATRTGSGEITFKSKYNTGVKEKTINANF